MQTPSENPPAENLDKPVCSICSLHPYKYKCPACGIRTCGIDCVKEHKSKYSCTGRIDPTKYVAMSEIKESDRDMINDRGDEKQHVDNIVVQRDYNFLLNLSRHIDLKKSDAFQSAKPLFQKRRVPNNNSNNRYKRARSEQYHNVFKKGTVSILQMPLGMQRAKQNKTFFDKKSQRYLWSLEFVFYISGSVNYKNGRSIILSKIPETDPLEKVLEMINDKALMGKNSVKEIGSEDSSPPEVINLRSCKYFFLKKIYNPNNTSTETPSGANNHLLAIKNNILKEEPEDIKQRTIKEILHNQLVLEFPTIYISDREEIPSYHIVDNIPYKISDVSDDKMKQQLNSKNIQSEQDSVPTSAHCKNSSLEDTGKPIIVKKNTNRDEISNSNATLSIAYDSEDDELEDVDDSGSSPLECTAV